MQEFVGQRLSDVVNILTTRGIKYIIVDNNFSVDGDEKLVTNAYTQDDTVVIVTGDFIFDVRNKNNEK